MTPRLLHILIVRPVVEGFRWAQSLERELLLVAIAIQESGLKARRQQPTGPARSWWQIEMETCIDCVDRCTPVDTFLTSLGCDELDLETTLEYNDLAACAIAAGILRLTKGRLPVQGNEQGAWQYYLSSWRPGKPRPASWAAAYRTAMKVVV